MLAPTRISIPFMAPSQDPYMKTRKDVIFVLIIIAWIILVIAIFGWMVKATISN